VTISCTDGNLTTNEVIHRLIGKPSNLGIQQGKVNILSLPGITAMVQGRQDSNRCIESNVDIYNRYTNPLRPASRFSVWLSGDTHQSAVPLDQIVITRLVCHRTGLAKTGYRQVNQFRIDLGQRFIIQAHFCQATDFKVFNQNIRLRYQLFQNFDASFGFQIQGNGRFIPICATEVCGIFGFVPMPVL